MFACRLWFRVTHRVWCPNTFRTSSSVAFVRSKRLVRVSTSLLVFMHHCKACCYLPPLGIACAAASVPVFMLLLLLLLLVLLLRVLLLVVLLLLLLPPLLHCCCFCCCCSCCCCCFCCFFRCCCFAAAVAAAAATHLTNSNSLHTISICL